jgi:hypothetical protein
MDDNILVRDDKYEGKYVAFQSVVDHTVVAEGSDASKVMQDAKENGVENPMLVFIPDKNMTCCY